MDVSLASLFLAVARLDVKRLRGMKECGVVGWRQWAILYCMRSVGGMETLRCRLFESLAAAAATY